MGRMLAEEIRQDGFFDGIDLIIPIPLTKKSKGNEDIIKVWKLLEE